MLNVIKMDLYRMLKNKITWIILIIIGIMAVTIMHTAHSEYEYITSHPENLVDLPAKYAEYPMYSLNTVFNIYYFYKRIIYNSAIGLFIAVFTVLFAGSENSTGFIKNIAGQPSIRYRTILSKCFSVFVFTSMALIFEFIIALVCSQLFFGYVSFELYSVSDSAAYFLTQMLLNTALGIVVLCVSELIRSPAVSMSISVLLSIGALRVLTSSLDKYLNLENFSFTQHLITVNISTLPLPFNSNEYHRAWIIGAVFLILTIAVSILSMIKRDIR